MESCRSQEGEWEGAVSGSPATLFDEPVPVSLAPERGAGGDVRVDNRGTLTACPAYLLVSCTQDRLFGHSQRDGLPGIGQRAKIRTVAGPWPVSGRWWAGEHARAYMRVTLEDGQVVLLVWSKGQWMVEGMDS